MDEKYTELAVKLEGLDVRGKSNMHRIDDLENEMSKMQETQIALVKLANGVDKMADQLVDMKEDLKDVKSGQLELNEKVNTMENQPALDTKKRWDSIADKLLWLFIAGVTGFLLAQTFPGIF